MNVLFDKKGYPMMAFGKKVLFTQKPVSPAEKTDDTFHYNKTDYVYWGANNRYPDDATEEINSVGVLSTGIDYRCRTTAGNGVVPVKIKGYDEKLNEIVEGVSDEKVINILNSYWMRKYHMEALRDIFKFGNAFPMLVFNNAGLISRVEIINARHARMSKDKKKLLVYNDFKNFTPSESEGVEYDMLSEADPIADLLDRRDKKTLPKTAIAFPRLKNYFSNNDYYATPAWDAVKEAGWIDVYKKIPVFLKAAYENAMSLMWQVQIPRSWWDAEYPEEEYANRPEGERQRDMEDRMRRIEENLCSPENANKALVVSYSPDEGGRFENKWTIEKLENDLTIDEKLSTSIASNSEILFALMINPAVFGAGLPGGAYAGGAGSGSDIREAFMVNIITNWVERNLVLDPIELMLEFNGYGKIDIKFKNLMLTTLDEGKSTKEKIS